MEFPHLLQLMQHNQFDTIYHEHFSYLAFFVVEQIFKSHGLRLFDVEELSDARGSIRIYGCHEDDLGHATLPSVGALRDKELAYGLDKLAAYGTFEERVKETNAESWNSWWRPSARASGSPATVRQARAIHC
jgi:hypothetical protein